MALTPKQVRNGIPGPGATGGNVAQPGPASAVPKGEAESHGNALASTGRQPFTGDTAGANGYVVPDWDASIAVTEQAGEA